MIHGAIGGGEIATAQEGDMQCFEIPGRTGDERNQRSMRGVLDGLVLDLDLMTPGSQARTYEAMATLVTPGKARRRGNN